MVVVDGVLVVVAVEGSGIGGRRDDGVLLRTVDDHQRDHQADDEQHGQRCDQPEPARRLGRWRTLGRLTRWVGRAVLVGGVLAGAVGVVSVGRVRRAAAGSGRDPGAPGRAARTAKDPNMPDRCTPDSWDSWDPVVESGRVDRLVAYRSYPPHGCRVPASWIATPAERVSTLLRRRVMASLTSMTGTGAHQLRCVAVAGCDGVRALGRRRRISAGGPTVSSRLAGKFVTRCRIAGRRPGQPSHALRRRLLAGLRSRT